MAELLFGMETEYAIGFGALGGALDRSESLGRLMELARENLVSLPGGESSGLFLENGARLYVDCGHHLEYATGECTTPFDIVRHVEAGHQIVFKLFERLQREDASLPPINIYRINVDYGGVDSSQPGSTWGCHESVSYRCPTAILSTQLIPHLVTRTIYTGAGGWAPGAPALSFSLSPRASHIRRVVSMESTSDRGIFHTRDESLSADGYHRLHILVGESLCSNLGIFLKVGTTSLIVAMIDAGLEPGRDGQLAEPLAALRAVARDVTCKEKLRLKGTRLLTAIEIQRQYLEMAESHLQDSFMPSWAGEVCDRWRDVLSRLESDPSSLCTMLDWPMKMQLYATHMAQRGLDFNLLPFWNNIQDSLQHAYRERLTAAPAAEGMPGYSLEHALSPDTPIRLAVASLGRRLRARGWAGTGSARLCSIVTTFMRSTCALGRLAPAEFSRCSTPLPEHSVTGSPAGMTLTVQ